MSDALSTEDEFALNVLLAGEVRAIRIDEGRMTLHALTASNEATVTLHPNARPEAYLRRVRELLSSHALGSPGGYPVYLSRWTRHGQMPDGNLDRLLLTGEPEAVEAVAYAPGLSNELAERVWWIAPSIEHARLMLRRQAVAQGHMGRVLADFLVEHLPFLHDDHLGIIDTVAVLLYSGALPADTLEAVWRRGKRHNTYYVAFLDAGPDFLPISLPERTAAALSHQAFAQAAQSGDPAAAVLLMALSGKVQAFLATVAEVLAQPETQEVVNRTLNALGKVFATLDHAACHKLAVRVPTLAKELAALDTLAGASETLTQPVFSRSTAIGSLMRRKIEPITAPLRTAIQVLLAVPQ